MKKQYQDEFWSHWLNMDPFGMTFMTFRLHLDPIWGVLAAFLVPLRVILETLWVHFETT